MRLKNEKFYLIIPAIALPFLCLIFSALGGGKGVPKNNSAPISLNPELPKPAVDTRKDALDKLTTYERAAMDSATRKKEEQRDSILAKRNASVNPPTADTRANDLLQHLDQLQQTLQRQQQARFYPRPDPPMIQNAPAPEPDPQLEKIDRLLDKVMHIQHPGAPAQTNAPLQTALDKVVPLDSSANTISVAVPDRQTLTTGATIALRLQDSIRVNGAVIPSGQMVYGVVNVNSDRMLIRINSIRSDRNIYTTDLQVYDLDGLPGIHIPGQLSRDVAKQSADQGLNGVNIMNYDPTLEGQAANAGIQAAKSLLSRKVRQVRVTVPAGYRLLLRDPKSVFPIHLIGLPGEKPGMSTPRPPGFVPGGPSLKHFTIDGIDLSLQDIGIQADTLWFGLTLHNSSSITYIPEYTRWLIRDRRAFRRTAAQELTLTPLTITQQSPLAPDSVQNVWTGFTPFALSRGKELVVEIGEKNSGRTLVLSIDHKQILNARRL